MKKMKKIKNLIFWKIRQIIKNKHIILIWVFSVLFQQTMYHLVKVMCEKVLIVCDIWYNMKLVMKFRLNNPTASYIPIFWIFWCPSRSWEDQSLFVACCYLSYLRQTLQLWTICYQNKNRYWDNISMFIGSTFFIRGQIPLSNLVGNIFCP